MRIYRTIFVGDMSHSTQALKWVESHLTHCSAEIIDRVGLAFCECVHNIIEHHIAQNHKMQLFASHKNIDQNIRHTHKDKRIHCVFVRNTNHIYITLTYPFKPCYKTLKSPQERTLGGRGMRIISLCRTRTRTKIHYARHRAILELRCAL